MNAQVIFTDKKLITSVFWRLPGTHLILSGKWIVFSANLIQFPKQASNACQNSGAKEIHLLFYTYR